MRAASVKRNQSYDPSVVCSQCGRENREGAESCAACGAPFVRRCAVCGTALDEAFVFCPSCGSPLDHARVGGHVEERKVVTVVFADLVGFTSRTERLDPEDVRAVLGPYQARLKYELERNGGTVEKFIGDAVMAIFGAPVSHEDDPERAVRAALAICDWATSTHEGLEIRIAVNTGEAFVALEARPEHGETMLVGDVVNTASRMQAAAPVNGILVGEATFRATRDVVEYRPHALLHARGKAEPIKVWQAIGALPPRGALEARPDSRFFGRNDELAVLRDAFARARREREPQFVTVLGVPGIGKSRLVAEFLASVREDRFPASCFEGRSAPYGDVTTLSALAEMVRHATDIDRRDSAVAAAARLRAAISELASDSREALWLEERLRPLVGLGTEEELGGALKGEAFAAWTRFFHAQAERPLVLVFEDLHWADALQLDFVEHLVERSGGFPIMTVATARPELLERRSGWGGGKRNSFTISLSPLATSESDQLVADLLNKPAPPAQVCAPLTTRVGGNPFFAGEFVRMLVERGLFDRAGDWWTLTEDELPVPESVQAIIASRLDVLPPEEKSLLQDAAVIGDVFSVDALTALAGSWGNSSIWHSLPWSARNS